MSAGAEIVAALNMVTDPQTPESTRAICTRFLEDHMIRLMSKEAVVMTLAAEGLRAPYLATPYTKRSTNFNGDFCLDSAGRAAGDAEAWAGWFAAHGVSVDCPISEGHRATMAGRFVGLDGRVQILEYDLDPLDVDFWAAWCAPRIERADCMVIPPIYGRGDSQGIAAEMLEFQNTGRPVFIIDGADESDLDEDELVPDAVVELSIIAAAPFLLDAPGRE